MEADLRDCLNELAQDSGTYLIGQAAQTRNEPAQMLSLATLCCSHT